jgi:hypothetical protein
MALVSCFCIISTCFIKLADTINKLNYFFPATIILLSTKPSKAVHLYKRIEITVLTDGL